MPIVFTKGSYPYVTLQQDACGNIHMWEGKVIAPTGDADTFIQFQSDIEALMDYLHKEERIELQAGYAISVKTIPDDYLVHE